ncbi:hypothetical protein ACJRW5_02205 [Pseudomonas sp. SH1-B]
MKADRDDAPEWLTSKPRKSGNMGAVIAGVIGMVVTLGALTLGGQAFMKNTVKNLAANSQQTKPKPVAEITRSEPTPRNDWDKIVEEQARRDAMSRQQQPEPETGLTTPVPKQTVFNDLNYTPKGAINLVDAREWGEYVPAKETRKQPQEIVVVGEQKRLKDYCPWPKGSIERRNCRMRADLNTRNIK